MRGSHMKNVTDMEADAWMRDTEGGREGGRAWVLCEERGREQIWVAHNKEAKTWWKRNQEKKRGWLGEEPSQYRTQNLINTALWFYKLVTNVSSFFFKSHMGNIFFPLKIENESKWVQLNSPSKAVLPEGPIRFMMLFITHFAVRAMGDQMSSSNRDEY